MCLAIYKPAGVKVPDNHLHNGFTNHPDGSGFAWSDGNQVHIKKGFFKYEEFMEEYKKVEEFDCLIHFRRASHGLVNVDNCHPFSFNDGKYAMIHNGMLPIKCEIKGLSDTAHYVKLVLDPLVKRLNVPIDDVVLDYLICTGIGNDKIAVMVENGEVIIFNQDKGTFENNVWYSNTSFRWKNNSTTTTTTHYPPKPSPGSNTPLALPSIPSVSNPVLKPLDGSKWKDKYFRGTNEDDNSYILFWEKYFEEKTERSIGTQAVLSIMGVMNEEDTKNKNSKDEFFEFNNENGDGTSKQQEEIIGPGSTVEYGPWEAESEQKIENLVRQGLSREQALIRLMMTIGPEGIC